METTFEQEMQQVRDERTYQENLRNSIINHEQKWRDMKFTKQ